MLQSVNVTLRRSSDAPLRRLHDVYGSEDGAETQLEEFMLAGERRVKGHAPPLTTSPDSPYVWSGLAMLLMDVSAYGAMGKMGGTDQGFCRRVQPLLTRLMKCILNGGFNVVVDKSVSVGDGDEDEDENEDAADVEGLLHLASKALANCSEGVARRCADTVLEVRLQNAPPPISGECDSPVAAPSESTDTLRVCFGFADYTSGETGALLWAGAVGLSLYLIENFTALVAQRARDVAAHTGQPLRVVELGCGPALVSLVLAAMAAREAAAVPCRLDVTDVSSTVVDEARRSFELRNGATVAAMVAAVEEEKDQTGEQLAAINSAAPSTGAGTSFTAHPFLLDFGAIPRELYGAYDVVVASDVVYDHAIAAHVAPALEALLKPGGVAFLCCEAHRDAMSYFTDRIRAGQSSGSQLRVVAEVRDVQSVLTRLVMLSSLTASSCSLIRIEKVAI